MADEVDPRDEIPVGDDTTEADAAVEAGNAVRSVDYLPASLSYLRAATKLIGEFADRLKLLCGASLCMPRFSFPNLLGGVMPTRNRVCYAELVVERPALYRVWSSHVCVFDTFSDCRATGPVVHPVICSVRVFAANALSWLFRRSRGPITGNGNGIVAPRVNE